MMHNRLFTFSLLLMICCLLTGCLRLTGQRVSLFHDVEADEVRLLIFYDGIHESDPEKAGNLEQSMTRLREGANRGDVMFLDWYGVLDRSEFAKNAKDKSTPPAAAALAQFYLENTKVELLGQYRTAEGEFGMVQHVTVNQFSQFLKRVNAAISEAVIRDPPAKASELPHTLKRLTAAAKADHQWIRLDGQAMILKFPVHPGEWRQANAGLLLDALEGPDSSQQPSRADLMRLVQAVTAASLGYSESDGWVTFHVGQKGQSTTFRFSFGRKYNDKLAKRITDQMPLSNAYQLLHQADDPKTQKAVADLKSWGPVEFLASSALARPLTDPEQRRAVQEALQHIADRWQNESGIPLTPAPVLDQDRIETQKAQWMQWIQAMRHYPLPEEIPAEPE